MPAAAEEIPIAVAGEIERNAVEPGRKGGVATETDEPAIGADEGVLRDFLGVGGVVQEIECQTINLASVAGDYLGEGGFVTGGEPAHQAGIDGSLAGRCFRAGKKIFRTGTGVG